MSRTRIKPPKRRGYAKRHKQIRRDNRLLARAMAYVLAEHGRPVTVPKDWMSGELNEGSWIVEDVDGDVRFRSLHPRKRRHRILAAIRTLPAYFRAKLTIRRLLHASKARQEDDAGKLERPGHGSREEVQGARVLLQAANPPDARVSELNYRSLVRAWVDWVARRRAEEIDAEIRGDS